MAQRVTIDATDSPELRRLAEHVRNSREPVALQVEGEELAVMIPLDQARDPRSFRPTPEQIKIAMSTFGALKGLIDPEQMKRDIRAARGHNPTPDDQ